MGFTPGRDVQPVNSGTKNIKTVRVDVNYYADTVVTCSNVEGFVSVYNEGKAIRIAYGSDDTTTSYRLSDPAKELGEINNVSATTLTIRLRGNTEDDTATCTVVYGQ